MEFEVHFQKWKGYEFHPIFPQNSTNTGYTLHFALVATVFWNLCSSHIFVNLLSNTMMLVSVVCTRDPYQGSMLCYTQPQCSAPILSHFLHLLARIWNPHFSGNTQPQNHAHCPETQHFVPSLCPLCDHN